MENDVALRTVDRGQVPASPSPSLRWVCGFHHEQHPSGLSSWSPQSGQSVSRGPQLTISFLVGGNNVSQVIVLRKRTSPIDHGYLRWGGRTSCEHSALLPTQQLAQAQSWRPPWPRDRTLILVTQPCCSNRSYGVLFLLFTVICVCECVRG